MKKTILIMALAALGLTAFGQMDDKAFPNIAVTNGGVGTASLVLRGLLEAVHIDVTAPATQTVAIATADGRTLFSKADISADGVFLPMAAAHTTAGAAATFNTYWSTGEVFTANAQTVYTKQPMAGLVTVTVTGQDGATTARPVKVTLIYSK